MIIWTAKSCIVRLVDQSRAFFKYLREFIFFVFSSSWHKILSNVQNVEFFVNLTNFQNAHAYFRIGSYPLGIRTVYPAGFFSPYKVRWPEWTLWVIARMHRQIWGLSHLCVDIFSWALLTYLVTAVRTNIELVDWPVCLKSFRTWISFVHVTGCLYSIKTENGCPA